MLKHMSFRRAWIMIGALVLLAACGGAGPWSPLPPVGITDLGTLGGDNSDAYHISNDGRVVTGTSAVNMNNTSRGVFRWTGGAMTSLSGSWSTLAVANGLSSDGAVMAVTDTASDNNGTINHAFRWTQTGGKVDLGVLPGANSAAANGISSDGTVVVGESSTAIGTRHAFRWTQSGGMVDLSGDFSSAAAIGASRDGAVVVGYFVGSEPHAFRWTQSGGIGDLGTLGYGVSAAYGVSADGSVVVGYAIGADGKTHPFRWTQSAGMIDLATTRSATWANYPLSWALSVSADGRVVVGVASSEDGRSRQAFRWTEETGMQTIPEWLLEAGITVPEGMTFQEANSTNQDGSIVVGSMSNKHAFLARRGQ